jgi:hypothetical protein
MNMRFAAVRLEFLYEQQHMAQSLIEPWVAGSLAYPDLSCFAWPQGMIRRRKNGALGDMVHAADAETLFRPRHVFTAQNPASSWQTVAARRPTSDAHNFDKVIS